MFYDFHVDTETGRSRPTSAREMVMRKDEIDLMVAALRTKCERESLSVTGLARCLGFSAGHLSMIFSGKRRPGLRFVQAVMTRFPGLCREISSRPNRCRRL